MKRIATRLSLSQAASGSISGVFTPFFSASLAWRGMSADQIGLVLSLALLLRAFVGPLSGIVADARDDRRTVMLALYWITVAGFGVLCVVGSPLLILLTAVTAYVAYGAANPLLESVSVRVAERHGFDYGRVRIWASTAFVVMNVAGGIAIKYLSLGIVAPLLALGAAACVICTYTLPAAPAANGNASLAVRLKATFGETRELLSLPVFLIFLAASSAVQATHAFYYGYGGLHWRTIGYSEMLIGIIWPLGVLGEIALFSQAPKVLAWLSPAKLLMLGGTFCAVRWTILAFDPPLPVVVFAQFMHGGTFALGHLGAVFFILRAVPQRLAATAQSLYYVCSQGLLMGIMTMASGSIYAAAGGKAYFMMAALGVVAIAFSFWLLRLWHGGRILAGEPHEQYGAL